MIIFTPAIDRESILFTPAIDREPILFTPAIYREPKKQKRANSRFALFVFVGDEIT